MDHRRRFRNKVDAAVHYLRIHRVAGKRTIVPPAWRLYWRLGMRIPPPHFMPFLTLALVIGGATTALGSVLFAAYDAFVSTSPLAWPFAGYMGAFVGVFSALTYRVQAWMHSVPRWRDFTPTDVF